MLTLGIVIGFAPFRLHEAFAPPSQQVRIDVKIAEIPQDEITRLGLPADFKENSWQEVDEEILGQWRAAQMAGVLQSMSEPTIVELDDQPSSLSIIQEVPVPNSNARAQIGTNIDIRAKLLRNGQIRLNLAPTILSLRVSPALAGGEQIPTSSKKSESFDITTELEDGRAIVFRAYVRGGPKPHDILIYVRATSVK